MKQFQLLLLAILLSSAVFCQKQDTIIVDPSNVNTKVLIPGTHRYLIYFKMGKDSSRTRYELWTRNIELINFRGREAISVTQEWENKDTIFHKVYSVCDRKSFLPLYQESWWRGSAIRIHDFIKNEAREGGRLLTSADTAKRDKGNFEAFSKSLGAYFLNWHLDLEVFPILPYKGNTTFLINYYDPGFPFPPQQVAYTVIGSAVLEMTNHEKADCWLLFHKQSETFFETFWISKKTKEVLKLEQEFGGKYRYKIKLPFSV